MPTGPTFQSPDFEPEPGGGGGTPGTGFPRVPHTPPAPLNTKLTLISFAEGIWRIDWRDVGPFSGRSEIMSPVDTWYVSTTPVSSVPAEGSLLDFALHVLERGTILTSVASQGNGKLLSYTHNGGSFKDIYVQVFGKSGGNRGYPSQPLRLVLSTDDATVPDETITQSVGEDLVAVDGLYYLDLTLQYGPPAVRTNFAGVELYVGNWSTLSLVEFGSIGLWDGVSRLQNFQVRLPEDSGQGEGVATFTNGDVTVLQVSGDNFGAGWAGCKIAVRSGGNGVLKEIDTVVPGVSLDLLSPWTGATGDYEYRAWNQMSLYFVPVGPTGVRRSDPTGSAVIVL